MDSPTFDLSTLDFTKLIADPEAIRKVLPHRYEMELLSGIVHLDRASHTIVGYKDCTEHEFWVRGHFPQVPMMPGVLMCEAAAQLCCYYTITQGIVDPLALQGLGGMDEVRFHAPVRPGERLTFVGRGIKVHRRMNRFHIVGSVKDNKVFEAVIVGVALGKWEDLIDFLSPASKEKAGLGPLSPAAGERVG